MDAEPIRYGGAQLKRHDVANQNSHPHPLGIGLKNGDVSSMERVITHLRDEARTLSQVLDELEKRLEPVTAKDTGDMEVPGPAPMPIMAGASSLATCIAEEARIVQSSKMRVLRLLRLLDI